MASLLLHTEAVCRHFFLVAVASFSHAKLTSLAHLFLLTRKNLLLVVFCLNLHPHTHV